MADLRAMGAGTARQLAVVVEAAPVRAAYALAAAANSWR
jgi:hypothetical protein